MLAPTMRKRSFYRLEAGEMVEAAQPFGFDEASRSYYYSSVMDVETYVSALEEGTSYFVIIGDDDNTGETLYVVFVK